MFRHAIVRPPAENFADGLTTVDFGKPDNALTLAQHDAYCAALELCGLELHRLPADSVHPDSTFVEDTAVLTSHSAILCRPGAPSRLGEVAGVRAVIQEFYPTLHEIRAPGTVDGGDICEAGRHFFIGISHRTNEEGARQLAEMLARDRYPSTAVDVRGMRSILHLKSGIAYLDKDQLVVMEEMAGREEFLGYERIVATPDESYACNCVLVNDHVLVPAGYPRLIGELERRGYNPLPLNMSEFRKMDGGLSCLSLRF